MLRVQTKAAVYLREAEFVSVDSGSASTLQI